MLYRGRAGNKTAIQVLDNAITLLLADAKKNRELQKQHPNGTIQFYRAVQNNTGIMRSVELLKTELNKLKYPKGAKK